MNSKKQGKIEKKDLCAMDYALQRIGGKYKGRILWRLNKKGIMRYGELKKSILDISTKMLTQTLRELEEDKLIRRKVYREIPPKVEYSLTEQGKELIPFFEYLFHWGMKQMNENYNPQKFISFYEQQILDGEYIHESEK